MKQSQTPLQASLSLFVIAGLFGFASVMIKPVLTPNYDASLKEELMEDNISPLPWSELCYEHYAGGPLTRYEIDEMRRSVDECLDPLEKRCTHEDYGQATRNGRMEKTNWTYIHWLNPFYRVYYTTVEESLTCDVHPVNRDRHNSQGLMDEYEDPGSDDEYYYPEY
jgi:hypothetical protein